MFTPNSFTFFFSGETTNIWGVGHNATSWVGADRRGLYQRNGIGLSLAIFIKEIALGTTPNRGDTERNGKELSFLVDIILSHQQGKGKLGEGFYFFYKGAIREWCTKGEANQISSPSWPCSCRRTGIDFYFTLSLSCSSASVWSNRINNAGWMRETFLTAKSHCGPLLTRPDDADKKEFHFFRLKIGSGPVAE